MQLTRKQINKIIEHTPEELKGTFPTVVEELGIYTKADANWSYHAGWTRAGDLVVTVYGEVQ